MVVAALILVGDGPAQARLDPLVVIQRQIHKANMLIVFDTSGSMTGVPGGTFVDSSECGIDCDNGDTSTCRADGVQGVCEKWTGHNCSSDDDCRQGYCSADNKPCKNGNGCDPQLGTCSWSGVRCSDNDDCKTNDGECSLTKDICNTSKLCPEVGKCSTTGAVCTTVGDACSSGKCLMASAIVCSTDSDCPTVATTGICRADPSGTPKGGCTSDADCPPTKACSSGYHCRTDWDCLGHSYTRGYCTGDNSVSCQNNHDCHNVGGVCVLPANTCKGVDNPCDIPHDTCLATPGTCNATTNACVPQTNTCTPAPPNVCNEPPHPNDVCVPSPDGAPGPIRMCRISQTVCRKNADCRTSGDSCGPATSRAIMAKRAVAKLVENSSSMVNFGLMTYYQNGYFPYYKSTTTAQAVSAFYPESRLHHYKCLDKNGKAGAVGPGPSAVCRMDGVDKKLRVGANSRYRVRAAPGLWIMADADWCGDWCALPGWGGMLGNYQGSYYETSQSTGQDLTQLLRLPTYEGQLYTSASGQYSYYKPLPNYYNGGDSPPIDTPNCFNSCAADCGGRWDTQLAPFLDTTDDPAKAQAASAAIQAWMAPAATGGLITYWSTPTGCTLENSAAPNAHASAYHYMKAVRDGNASLGVSPDRLSCRDNFILLVTDGAANGPGDDNCDSTACAKTNPESGGCKCRAVLAAYHMRKDLGVRTFVVGFGGDAGSSLSRSANDNIARAGGTDAGRDNAAPFAFLAQNEDELLRALQLAVFDAVRGSYSTAPTSTSAGTQQANTVAEGRYALDSRVDFPEWKGHLLAYDLAGTSPVLAWDAGTKLDSTNWWERRIYTWTGSTMVKIQVDPTTKAVTNKAALAGLGLGATDAEAEHVARWLLGDPALGNPARLGALINTTPIDVASPGDFALPGGHAYFTRYANRPHLIYVGSSDGMLHAFFLENTKVGTKTYAAGSEAFAVLPPNMLATVRKLYSQGGQLPDPYKHIYGLANSPKAKTLCVQNCTDAATAVWKTLLLMPEGYGGAETFMLDVTAPFASDGLADPPVAVQWYTDAGTSKTAYDSALGNTMSLPAFLFNKTTSLDDYRVVFASGYSPDSSSTTQGRALLLASATDGHITDNLPLTPASTCSQPYAAVTDVATARDFGRGQDQRLAAAFFGDTAGRLWRYQMATGVVPDTDFGCNYPLHFAPTVVQLDRDAISAAHAREIFTVQVTNSNIDLETTGMPASRLVFMKRVADVDAGGNISGMHTDNTFGTGGSIVFEVGKGTEICGVTKSDTSGNVTCLTALPSTARPTSTPLGILRKSADGFQVFTMWYVPGADGCSKGASYLTVHQLLTNKVSQRLGVLAANEPATSPLVLGGHVYVFGAGGPIDVTGSLTEPISAGRAVPPVSTTSIYGRLNWYEVE